MSDLAGHPCPQTPQIWADDTRHTTTCDVSVKRLLIEHALLCPKSDLVLEHHDDAEKEWGSLESRALVPSSISYKPKIKSRTVQGERTGAGARQDGGIDDGSAPTVGKAQWGSVWTVNGRLYQ